MAKKLSELEGVALGLVYKHQPCTSYAVRHELEQSPSTRWRGSSGSIYPLLRRLEERGLVESTPDEKDGRGRQLLAVTAAGVEALRAWVVAGCEPDIVAAVSDPVRSRLYFLELLSDAALSQFIAETESALKQYLTTTREHLTGREESADPLEHLANLGAVYQAEARVRWLEAVRRALKLGEAAGRED